METRAEARRLAGRAQDFFSPRPLARSAVSVRVSTNHRDATAMSFHCIGPGHPPVSANAFKQVASNRWIVTLECQEAINEVRCDHPAHCAPVPPTARRRRASRSSLSSLSPWSRALRSAATSRRRLLRSRRGTTSGQSPRRRRR